MFPDGSPDSPNQETQGKPCKVFLGFTSNLISSGTREILKFLCKNKLIDVMVTTAGLFLPSSGLPAECSVHPHTWLKQSVVANHLQCACPGGTLPSRAQHKLRPDAGGVEEDLIKCLAPTYIGSFYLSGKELRLKGQNRIGNMLVPNNNYCAFEEFMTPILDEMLQEQEEKQVNWTPSRMIARLGERIANEESVYYWCVRHSMSRYASSASMQPCYPRDYAACVRPPRHHSSSTNCRCAALDCATCLSSPAVTSPLP